MSGRRLYKGIGFLAALLVPALVFYSFPFGAFLGHGSTSSRVDDSAMILAPHAPVAGGAPFADQLRLIPNPRNQGYSLRSLYVPFVRAESGKAGDADPFLQAYLNGTQDGVLVPRGGRGRVALLGPPGSDARLRAASDGEILQHIDSGLGGSFGRFFSRVLRSKPPRNAASGPGEEEGREENPFLEAAIEAMAETPPPNPAVTDVVASEKPPSAEKGTADAPPASRPALDVGSSTATVRPHALLRVESDGSLRVVQVSQPRDGVLDSAEMGAAEFQLLPFHDAAEIPVAMAAANFNHDAHPDLALHIPYSGLLRVYLGTASGGFDLSLEITTTRAPSSLAAADFDRDGYIDLAIARIGVGLVTILFGDDEQPFRRFKTFWLDLYRDYISPGDSSNQELIGVNFTNRAAVLLDFRHPDARGSSRRIDYQPALSTDLVSYSGKAARLNAALFGRNLSVNLENRQNLLANVLNVAAGTDLYVMVGDLDTNGTLDLVLARRP